MLNFDVKRKINTLRDILVGKVPDPKAQVEQITIALIYKFMDDMDIEGAEFGGNRVFFTEDFEKYAWSNIMQPENSGQQRAILYAEGIDKMAMNPHLPQLFRDIFRGAYVPYRDPETLNMFLKEIAEFSYDNSEDLGNAFEYLLSIMGSQGDAGQFRTPRHIIDMMVEIIDPKKNETVLDPACGTAGFLISAYKHILKNNKNENGKTTLTADDRKRLGSNFAGYDISPDMVRLSRVNMYLHKFTKPNISEYDTLTSEDKWDDDYDVILANPPFMTPKGGIIPHNRYRVKAKRAEVLFVDYIAEHLNPTGRAGIIVPEGIVFQSANAYKNLRKFLIEDNLLYAVISLPAGVFQPYSAVKTSILLIDKTIARCTDDILFVKLSNDGFDLGAQRREIKGSGIPDIIETFQKIKKSILKDNSFSLSSQEQEYCTIASKEDIAKQDYILVGERYKEAVVHDTEYPMVEIEKLIENVKYTEKVLKSDFLEIGQFPIIDQSENFIAGYSNNQNFVFNVTKPLICFGDHTRVLKYVDFNFVLGADGIKILQPVDEINTKYMYYCLLNTEIPSLGYSRHYKVLKEVKIPLPPLSVQEEIVKEIESYQKIIDGARQIVDNYRPVMKYNPEWEIVKLSDIIEFNPPKSEVKHLGPGTKVSFVPMATVNENDMFFDTQEERSLAEVYQGYTFFKENDVILAKVTPCFENGKAGLAKDLKNGIGFGSSEFFVLRAKACVLPELLYYFVHSTNFIDEGKKNMSGTGGLQRLVKDFVLNYSVALPTFETQQQIVAQINEEMAIVEQNKRLIEIFEQKIKDKISEVWGE